MDPKAIATDTSGTDLYSLLYCSHATRWMTPDELPHIVGSAWRHNPPLEITGLLVFGGGMFLQWLEGPQAHVQALMQRLRQDRRHECVMELHAFGGVQHRLYPFWSMQLVGPMDILAVLEQERRKSPHPHHVQAINMLMDMLQMDEGPLTPLRND